MAQLGAHIWKVPEVMATIGPTLERPQDLLKAIEAGASWFRLPCGYRQRPHIENASAVRWAAGQVSSNVRLLLDLPSSRPRTGKMQEQKLTAGSVVVFWDSALSQTPPDANGYFPVPLPGTSELCKRLAPKQRMWFCDGRLSFEVEEVRESSIAARLVQGTVPLKSSNALFLPDNPSAFCTITPEDRHFLKAFASAAIVPDWIALSLIANPRDIEEGRREARQIFGQEVRMMAKFETVAAVDCAEEIIEVADAIMVARGDLGLAVGHVRLPEVQAQLVAAARRAGKVVVVATQILECYAETGVPQRAELSDLSLIAQQRADVVMLGRETVYSPRPIECIQLAQEVLAYETHRFQREEQESRVSVAADSAEPNLRQQRCQNSSEE